MQQWNRSLFLQIMFFSPIQHKLQKNPEICKIGLNTQCILFCEILDASNTISCSTAIFMGYGDKIPIIQVPLPPNCLLSLYTEISLNAFTRYGVAYNWCRRYDIPQKCQTTCSTQTLILRNLALDKESMICLNYMTVQSTYYMHISE